MALFFTDGAAWACAVMVLTPGVAQSVRRRCCVFLCFCACVLFGFSKMGSLVWFVASLRGCKTAFRTSVWVQGGFSGVPVGCVGGI